MITSNTKDRARRNRALRAADAIVRARTKIKATFKRSRAIEMILSTQPRTTEI